MSENVFWPSRLQIGLESPWQVVGAANVGDPLGSILKYPQPIAPKPRLSIAKLPDHDY